MKKLFIVLLSSLLLAGCSAKTRTEVIDVLLDAGYSKNSAGYYQLEENDTTFRIGYISSYEGYTESLHTIFGEGPVVIMDVKGDSNYNYQVNDDIMYYTINCKSEDTKQATSTEIAYVFKTEDFVIGMDGCKFDSTKEEELTETFKAKREVALSQMDTLGLSAKDLNNLKLK